MSKINSIKYIANYYKDKQYNKTIEELSELSTSISRYIGTINSKNPIKADKEKYRNEIIEETADVYVMLAQIKYLLGCENQVSTTIEYKIDRQLERIRKEKMQFGRTREERNFK